MNFLEKYQEIRPTLYSNFLMKTDALRLDRANIGLEQFVYSIFDLVQPYEIDEYKRKVAQEQGLPLDADSLSSLDVSLEEYDDYRHSVYKNSGSYDIVEFIILASLSGYHHQSNIDISRLKEKAFGFENCLSSIIGIICNTNTNESSANAKSKTEVNLLSYIRSIPFSEYISQELFMQDVENIAELLDKSSNTYGGNKERKTKDVIEKEMYDIIQSKLAVICKRYSYIMGGAFGVDNYKGVFTGQQVATCQGVDSSGHLKIIEPDNELNSSYRSALLDCANFVICSDLDAGCNARQFDKELIYKNVSKTPIYFPYKVLEIISKCVFTSNKQILSYNKMSRAEAGTLDVYVNEILRKAFTADMLDFMYLCLANYLAGVLGSTDNVNEMIVDALETKTDSFYNSMCEDLYQRLNYYVDCVTTAVVLDKLETGTETTSGGSKIKKILEFRFKVCSKLKIDTITNAGFLSVLRGYQKRIDSDMPGVEDCSPEHLECDMYGIDFQYVYNKEKVYARPVFAYKALKALQETTGQTEGVLGWHNILLGRDIHDGLVSSQYKKDNKLSPYHLQDHNSHFIIAGSRAGKGVMCYNIFATAIASEMPIFYLDGKPDTATVLKGLCPDTFAFNAGDYNGAMDYEGHFKPENYTFKYPSYVSDKFAEREMCFYYAGLRCVMLAIAMVYYSDRCSGLFRDELTKVFKNGIILVLDEYSEFNKNFLHKKFTAESEGWFGDALSSEGIKKAIKESNETFLKLKMNIASEEAKGDKANQLKLNNLRNTLENFQSTNMFPLSGLYTAAIADSYKDLQLKVSDIQNRGSRLWKGFHVFVIGQDFNDILNDLSYDSWYKEGGGTNARKFNSSQGINPLTHILNSMNPDVITGFNRDRSTYLAQTDRDYKTINLLNENRRCFAYKETGKLTPDELRKLTNTKDALGSPNSVREYLNSWNYFKPFLILNNGITPLDEHPDTGDELIHPKGVSATSLDGMRKGAAPAPSGNIYSASQYVGQCLTQCEKAGLTWEDLLEDNLDENGRLSTGIGFDGYIRRLGSDKAIGAMSLSGNIANQFVQQVIGYPGSWVDFVCDFNPEWIFKISDFDEVTGKFKPINIRLSGTYFNNHLLTNNFVEMFGDKTETLQQYYTDTTGFSTENKVAINPVDTEDDDFFDEEQDLHEGSSSEVLNNQYNELSSGGSDGWETFFDDFDEEDDLSSYESEYSNEEVIHQRKSMTDLRKIAETIMDMVRVKLNKPLREDRKEYYITWLVTELRKRGY